VAPQAQSWQLPSLDELVREPPRDASELPLHDHAAAVYGILTSVKK
jgi:hypothetical protein